MRRARQVLLLAAGTALAGCGDDPFGVEDALGTWDLRQVNDLAISGMAPVGVWMRENGGADSSLVVVESIVLEFQAAATCVWTFDDGIQGAETEDDCAYVIAADGSVSVTVGGMSFRGSGEGTVMTLRDDATNELVFAKRP